MKKKTDKIYLPKWMLILNEINGKNSLSDIQRITQITYSYIFKIVNELQDIKWIHLIKSGRVNIPHLTAYGEIVREDSIKLTGSFSGELKQ